MYYIRQIRFPDKIQAWQEVVSHEASQVWAKRHLRQFSWIPLQILKKKSNYNQDFDPLWIHLRILRFPDKPRMLRLPVAAMAKIMQILELFQEIAIIMKMMETI